MCVFRINNCIVLLLIVHMITTNIITKYKVLQRFDTVGWAS